MSDRSTFTLEPMIGEESFVVRLGGRIDATNADEVEQQCGEFIATGQTQMLLDLAELDYISSAGLRVILLLSKQCVAKGGKLLLANMKGMVGRTLDISGFDMLAYSEGAWDETDET
jgi:anti-anti-sigma factor